MSDHRFKLLVTVWKLALDSRLSQYPQPWETHAVVAPTSEDPILQNEDLFLEISL